ncbi:hypothetical protein [Aporhodopirellula aestuarii]|uniref:Uncharacterized protein n=1 Tax=Aporhodopirellula aestuarii TaxID=2950107 RepID=A0ABT0U4I9_9BACT|nr:hypothetical protein [Aporhodopirellula aestuarii]MCM2371775.1 hypothetical protein [Aporhodopirellula aestuarii]
MIGEYKIGRTTRRCSVSNRPLEPGEYYYSVVTEGDEEFHRVDIAADAWTGPPEGCIGHWKNRVPLPEEKKRGLAPPEVLIELLRSMADQPAQAKMRYLLALTLLRKRSLKPYESSSLIQSETNDDAVEPDAAASEAIEPSDGDELETAGDLENAPVAAKAPSPKDLLRLESTIDGSILTIEVCDIAAGEAESLQEQLVELMYHEVE